MKNNHTTSLCLAACLLALAGCERTKSLPGNATDKNRIEFLLASQTNSADMVRAIRHCLSEMPGLLDRLPTEEDRARWIGRWEDSLWRLADGARSYREKMGVVCTVEEAVFAVKAAREKCAPNGDSVRRVFRQSEIYVDGDCVRFVVSSSEYLQPSQSNCLIC